MRISLHAPTFTDGELLSANKLNLLSESVNVIRAESVGQSGVFNVIGTNQTWYLRRRWRYLHVAYSVTPQDGSVAVSIDFGTSNGNDYTHPSSVNWQWRTFDLNSVGGTTVGGWYGVTVERSGNNFTFATNMIMESESSSPTDVGSYTAPPTWQSGEAVGATKLNALSDAVMRFDGVVVAPNSAALRGETEGQTYTLRRRGRWLEYSVTVGGDNPDVNVWVHQTKVFNDGASGTYTVDLNALSPSPAVGAWYTVRFERLAGTGELRSFREIAATPTSYAPAWTHGENSFLAKINSYAGLLDEAQVVLGLVGWQPACLHRPYEHPRWFGYKTQRYLHYMRNGSTAASIVDPSGENDSVGLSRTTNAKPFAAYDLDSVDWLAPGGLFYVDEADVVCLRDEP
jgi:hypothetical protein